jgi:hypothetical protein
MAFYREAYIIRIASDPVALLWSGYGDLLVPADTVVPEDSIALGGGGLVSVPDFQQLINGTAERLEYILSGISEEMIRLALEDAPSVAGSRVDLGRMDMDGDWQQIAPVEWEATFEARSLEVGSGWNGASRVRTLKLTVAAGDTTRSRAPLAFFTDADQRRRSPDDAIFSHVAAINGGTSRRFGPAS